MKKSALIFILVLTMVFFTTGCANSGRENAVQESIARAEDYLASVKEQSDAIKHSLENDPLTQTELNAKSQELYKLWDDALNFLLTELASCLPEAEFEKLQEAQDAWTAKREQAAKEAGKGFEGGSIYPLLVNSEAAKLTEDRAYELYELLKAQ